MKKLVVMVVLLVACTGCVRQVRVHRDDQDVTVIAGGLLWFMFLRADDDTGRGVVEAEGERSLQDEQGTR